MSFFAGHLQCRCSSGYAFIREHTMIVAKSGSFQNGGCFMRWEYKIVALGLIVDATEPNQREQHEKILNDLGCEGWEAFAYSAQSDTVLLKKPSTNAGKSEKMADPTAETS